MAEGTEDYILRCAQFGLIHWKVNSVYGWFTDYGALVGRLVSGVGIPRLVSCIILSRNVSRYWVSLDGFSVSAACMGWDSPRSRVYKSSFQLIWGVPGV